MGIRKWWWKRVEEFQKLLSKGNDKGHVGSSPGEYLVMEVGTATEIVGPNVPQTQSKINTKDGVLTNAEVDRRLSQNCTDINVRGGNLNIAWRDVVNITTNNFPNDTSINILDQLPSNNSRAIHADNHAKRTKDTCLWFIEGILFQTFLQGKGGILWGTGMPGAGKTVLASVVITYFQDLAVSSTDICVSFAYCRYTEDIPVVDILMSLIRQQAERHPSVEEVIGPIFARHKREKTRPSLDELSGILNMISKQFRMNVYILDGVDEVKGDVQVKLVRILSSVGAHFFLTSRPLKELELTVPGAVFFPIEAQDYDLELMVDERIKDTPRFQQLLQANSGLKEEILAKIKEKARGMFLHATLQMETLRHCVTVTTLRKEMEAFPLKTEDLYRATLGRIANHPHPEQVRIAKEALVWVINAKRDLTIDELRYALSFSSKTRVFQDDGMVAENVLISLCFGLLTMDKRSRLVRLAHYTAKDVLQHLLAVDFTSPHEILATTCIARLISCHFQGQNLVTWVLEGAFQSNILLEYAHSNWAAHTQACDGQSAVWNTASQFVQGCQSYPDSTFFRWDVGFPVQMLRGIHLIARYNLPQLIAPSTFGIHQVQPWKALDVNATTEGNGTPLMLASYHGHGEVVRLLLGVRGIQVNAITASGYTALMLASREGHDEVVSLLAGVRGIDLNARDTVRRYSALMLAVWNGHEKVAQRLLEIPRIQVNLTNKEGRTALMKAAESGHERTVELLLKFPGIQVDVVDRMGNTALQLASEEGHQAIVQLLCEREPIPSPKSDFVHRIASTISR